MYYNPKYFNMWELVNQETYLKFGDSAIMLLNPLLLITLDGLREILGVPLIVNNWREGGTYEYSGYRPIDCTIGAKYSQHRLGNAADIKPLRMTIGDAFNKIINNKEDERIKELTTIENIAYTPSWLHVSCQNIPDRIRIVKP